MSYTDPSTLTWNVNENPLQSAKLNQATNDQFLALFPDGAAAVDWTPALEAATTDPSTSAVTGRRWRLGPFQFLLARFVLSTAGSGEYFVTLPTTASGITANTGAGLGQAIGTFHARDISPAWMLQGNVLLKTTDEIVFHASSYEGIVGGGEPTGVLSHTNPRDWGSGDVISLAAFYPVA